MRGLSEIVRMNELEAARALRGRYRRLRSRALRRGDFFRAKRYDGYVEDFTRYLSGEIRVFPGPKQKKAGLFQPSEGRDFSKMPEGREIPYTPEFRERVIRLDPGNERLAGDLSCGRPIGWWFENRPELKGPGNVYGSWVRRQFEELLGYYRLLA